MIAMVAVLVVAEAVAAAAAAGEKKELRWNCIILIENDNNY